MELCKKHGIKVTGCSKWNGGDHLEICQLCLSELGVKGILFPSNKTPVKKHYNTVKTLSNTVKTMPFLGDGGDSE